MIAISFVSGWLSHDLVNAPLSTIQDEIMILEKKPLQDRSVADVERLDRLCEARAKILRSRHVRLR